MHEDELIHYKIDIKNKFIQNLQISMLYELRKFSKQKMTTFY